MSRASKKRKKLGKDVAAYQQKVTDLDPDALRTALKDIYGDNAGDLVEKFEKAREKESRFKTAELYKVITLGALALIANTLFASAVEYLFLSEETVFPTEVLFVSAVVCVVAVPLAVVLGFYGSASHMALAKGKKKTYWALLAVGVIFLFVMVLLLCFLISSK